jgi:hypothetical protein
MSEIVIEQALYGSQAAGGYQFLARSPGFRDDWLSEAERLCTGFGERPAGVACPGCVFAQPFGKGHVAVIQAADQGTDDAGRPGALGFRVLVLPQNAYAFLGGDPFALADRFPPSWSSRGELPALDCPAEPPAPRTIAQVQGALERFREMQPTLLGGVQSLVDGGRVVFERPAPDTELLRCLWMLLPTSTRAELWPASFAFGNTLGFDALIVPRVEGSDYAGYLHERHAGDYPEGRYELGLQVAVESGDQEGLDILFARRSRRQVWQLALILLAAALLLTLVMNWLSPNRPPAASPPASTPAGPARPDLGAAEEYPPLNDAERQSLTASLTALAKKLGLPGPLPATPEELLQAIDQRLGLPDPQRDPGPLGEQGPPVRQLRALLWKHQVPEYNDRRLNPRELVERLDARVAARPADTKPGGP